MPVSGSKGPEQLAVEVAEALWRRGSALSSLAADCRSKGASSVKPHLFFSTGVREECFRLRRAPRRKWQRAGLKPPRSPPLCPPRLSRLVAGGPFEKTAKLKRCNMAIFVHLDRAHNGNYEPCGLKEACGMAELRLRTVCRIKNVSANHPALELLLTKPTRLFISPESLVLCLHLLVKPCQFFRLGFTCEPERHLD